MKKNKNFYPKLSFIEKIFSIKNYGKYKFFTFFNYSIKIDRTTGISNYKKLENKIVFNNFNGHSYGCNPKYISEECLKRNLNCRLIWLLDKKYKADFTIFPKNIEIVNFKSLKAIKEILTSKIFINNVRANSLINRGWTKQEKQFYIQTWHGSLGIKKIDAGVNTESWTKREWFKTAQKDSTFIDCLLSNSTFEDNIYQNDFWYKGKIYKFGHPRNDIFFKSKKELDLIKDKIVKKYKLDKEIKILLYVPSFRDNGRVDCFNLNLNNLQKELDNHFNCRWIILTRMHPHLENKNLGISYSNQIINATDYPDIQELLVASDIAITDYSSCIFDFMLSRKPAFIYATDIEKYNNERGFYYPLDSTPFPIATNNDEMIENIKNFNYEQYKIDVEKFLKEKGCMEDGKASERVVDLIEEIMEHGYV